MSKSNQFVRMLMIWAFPHSPKRRLVWSGFRYSIFFYLLLFGVKKKDFKQTALSLTQRNTLNPVNITKSLPLCNSDHFLFVKKNSYYYSFLIVSLEGHIASLCSRRMLWVFFVLTNDTVS